MRNAQGWLETVRRVQRLSWISVGLCCLAVMIEPYPLLKPLFLTLIAASLVIVAYGLVCAQRAQRDVEEAITLQDRWKAQRDRCKPAVWSYTPPPEPVPETPPAPAPRPEPEPAQTPTRTGRDLIFEEADQ